MTNDLELMAMGVVPYPTESPDGVPQWNAPRGTTIAEAAAGEFVLASDYDRLEQECERLKSIYEEDTRRLTGVNALADDLKSERDALRAHVEVMRAALLDAAQGIRWLQASVPMSIRISKRACKDYSAAMRAALNATHTALESKQ